MIRVPPSVDREVDSDRVTAVKLHNPDTTDETMSLVANFTELRSLSLSFTSVTADGLKRLIGLRKLDLLELRGVRITDGELDVLHRMPQLRTLSLEQVNVTPEALRHLAVRRPELEIKGEYVKKLRARASANDNAIESGATLGHRRK